MNKKYVTPLAEEDHTQLLELIAQGETKARVNNRARILLKAHQGWSDQQIAKALNTSSATVQRTRQRYSQGGLALALYDKPRTGAPPKFGGEQKAHIIATTCSNAPGGKARWTLRLVAQKTVELGIADSISHETVRQILKKTS